MSGISLHFGQDYGVGVGGGISTATKLHKWAAEAGFDARLIVGEQVVRATVLAEISGAISRLTRGDVLLITWLGHGRPQATSVDPKPGEELQLADGGALLDKDLLGLWHRLPPGVEVRLLVDACHSQDIIALVGGGKHAYGERTEAPASERPGSQREPERSPHREPSGAPAAVREIRVLDWLKAPVLLIAAAPKDSSATYGRLSSVFLDQAQSATGAALPWGELNAALRSFYARRYWWQQPVETWLLPAKASFDSGDPGVTPAHMLTCIPAPERGPAIV